MSPTSGLSGRHPAGSGTSQSLEDCVRGRMTRRVVRSVAEDDAAFSIQDENTGQLQDVTLRLSDGMAPRKHRDALEG